MIINEIEEWQFLYAGLREWLVRQICSQRTDFRRNAVSRAEQGLINADLGGGLIKQRVARQVKASLADFVLWSFFAKAI